MMTYEAMEKFRAQYRANIRPGYRGSRHMGIVFLTALAIIIYTLANVENTHWFEWLVFPFTMLLINFAEYYNHRWLGHKKTKIGQLFYSRHTGDHHSFFLSEAMGYESTRDWRVVLFPTFLLFAVLTLLIPIAWGLSNIFSENTGYLFIAGGLTGYLYYEIMHFSYHVPPNSAEEQFFMKIPFWQQLRHLHVLHHRREVMHEKNFNITLPIFDYVLGTLYWEDIAKYDELTHG